MPPTQTHLGLVLRHLNRLLGEPVADAPEDGDLLDRFIARRDEAAFAELLRRHGPMVLGVCHRLLGAGPDADDAFQATFLVLVHKAKSVRRGTSLGCWLYGISRRLALKARAAAARRRAYERRAADMRVEPTNEPGWDDVRPILDEELARLPQRLRAPLVLCYLEGKTNIEAARELGWPAGSLSKLLARGREMLRLRLTRRGVALSAGALALLLAQGAARAAVPAALGQSTLAAGLATTAGAVGIVSARVASLVQSGVRDMFLAKCKLVLAVVLTLAALGAGAAVLKMPQPPQPPEKPGGDAVSPAVATKPSPSLDQQDDPLPAGARARLGTMRLRHGHAVQTVAFAPDGKSFVSTGGDHLARRWEVPTGREIATYGQQIDRDKPYEMTRWMHAVAFAPDGKTLATGDHAEGWQVHTIRIWDAAAAKQLRTLEGHTNGVLCLAYSPDGKTLASCSVDETVRLWDPDKGTELRTLAGHTGRVNWVAWSRDGKRLASAGADGTVRLWDADKGTELRSITAHEGGAQAVSFSPDGKRLVTGGADKTIRLWDADKGTELRKLAREKEIRIVAFSHDGRLVACGGAIDLLLWDPDSGQEVRKVKGSTNEVRSVAFSPDDKQIAAAPAYSDTVLLWETATGKRLADPPGHEGYAIGRVSYSADGRVITTVGSDGTQRVWDAATGMPLRRNDIKQSGGHNLATVPGGKGWYAGFWDGTVRRLDAAGKEERRWKAHEGPLSGLALSPDSKVLATAGMVGKPNEGKPEGRVVLWEAATGKELRRFDAEVGAFRDLVFSPDGTRLAVVITGQPARVYETATGKEVRLTPPAPPPDGVVPPGGGVPDEAVGAAFSPDGKLLATGGQYGAVRLWDLATGRQIRVFNGHAGWVQGLAFSADGRTLAAGNWRNVKLWEVATGQQRRRLEGHEGDACALAFSPDGRSLASGSSDTTGLVWDLAGRPAELPPTELELAWTDLRGNDAARAYAALWQLAGSPKQALPLLREVLAPARSIDADRVAKLITALDDDDFEKREKATDDLARMGEQVGPALKKALEGSPPVEVRRRVEYLLERLRTASESNERLRQVRALEVVEMMATPEARGLLEELAKGPAEAWLTGEAKTALRRSAPPRP
jgi:RNA polymerase sigma factor (sigma-70 family)